MSRTVRMSLSFLLGVMIPLLFHLNSIELNVQTEMVRPVIFTPLPHSVEYFAESQDARLVASAGERAACIDSGRCPWSHEGFRDVLDTHITAEHGGENLARDFDSWEEVMKAWYSSPSHNRVLTTEWCIYGASQSGNTYVLHVACE